MSGLDPANGPMTDPPPRRFSRFAEWVTVLGLFFAVVTGVFADRPVSRFASVGLLLLAATAAVRIFGPDNIGGRATLIAISAVWLTGAILVVLFWPILTSEGTTERSDTVLGPTEQEQGGAQAGSVSTIEQGTSKPQPPASPVCDEDVGTMSLVYEEVGRNPLVQWDAAVGARFEGQDPDSSGGFVVSAVADGSGIEIRSVDDPTNVQSRSVDPEAAEPTVTADGTLVVATQRTDAGSRLVYWNVASGEVGVLLDRSEEVDSPSLSADGSHIAWVQGSGRQATIRVARLSNLAVSEIGILEGSSPDLDGDGSRLLHSAPFGDGRAIHISTSDGSSSRRITQPRSTEIDEDPAWIPGCDSAVFTRSDNDGTDLWLTDGSNDTILRDLVGRQSQPSMVPLS